MGAITSGCTFKEANLVGLKVLNIKTANTADTGDTIVITLADYGITSVLGVLGMKETTEASVLATENPTTSITAGVLTLTLAGTGVDDIVRDYTVFGW